MTLIDENGFSLIGCAKVDIYRKYVAHSHRNHAFVPPCYPLLISRPTTRAS